jgi:hypothetical protein
MFSDVRYNGSATVPSEVGTYQIRATFTPTDTTNYHTQVNVIIGNYVISKANPVLSVTNSPQTYNGSPKSATVSANVAGTVSNILTGGAAAQVNAGTYAVTANFAPTDTAHYNTLTGAGAGNFVIAKATPTATLNVTNSPIAYDGGAHSAAGGIVSSSTPGAVANILTGGAAFQVNVGVYPVTADFVPTDLVNYNIATGLSAGDFEIAAMPAELITNGGFNLYSGTLIPTNWSAVKFAATDGKHRTKKEGLFSIRIMGAAGQRKTLTQEVLTSGSAGDAFTFKAWFKGQSIPAAGTCQIQVFLYDGNVLQSVRSVACPTGTFDWTQKTLSFTAPLDYTRAVVKITVLKASGYVWFDGLSLIK